MHKSKRQQIVTTFSFSPFWLPGADKLIILGERSFPKHTNQLISYHLCDTTDIRKLTIVINPHIFTFTPYLLGRNSRIRIFK